MTGFTQTEMALGLFIVEQRGKIDWLQWDIDGKWTGYSGTARRTDHNGTKRLNVPIIAGKRR